MRLGQRVQHLPRHLGGVLRLAAPGAQDDEPVAADPGDGVGRLHAALQPQGDGLQHAVAAGLAERIGQRAEPPEVDAEHRDGAAFL